MKSQGNSPFTLELIVRKRLLAIGSSSDHYAVGGTSSGSAAEAVGELLAAQFGPLVHMKGVYFGDKMK